MWSCSNKTLFIKIQPHLALGPYIVSLTVTWKGWAQGLGPLLFTLSRAHPSSMETLWTLSPHSVVTSCLGIKAPLKGTSLIIKVFLFQTLLQRGSCMLHDHSWARGGWGWTAVFLHLKPWGLVKKKKKASPAFTGLLCSCGEPQGGDPISSLPTLGGRVFMMWVGGLSEEGNL